MKVYELLDLRTCNCFWNGRRCSIYSKPRFASCSARSRFDAERWYPYPSGFLQCHQDNHSRCPYKAPCRNEIYKNHINLQINDDKKTPPNTMWLFHGQPWSNTSLSGLLIPTSWIHPFWRQIAVIRAVITPSNAVAAPIMEQNCSYWRRIYCFAATFISHAANYVIPGNVSELGVGDILS